ncbi:MAG: cytochrome c, partial [Helicobacter sp.]|nr:cytochrome c [Helicobacter sp.]
MMKKLFLSVVLSLSFLNAEDCVCFELKGEFGEEIKAILKKYSKNLGSKDIQVIREDADLTPQEKNFLESLIGTGKVNHSNKQTKLENGKKLIQRD